MSCPHPISSEEAKYLVQTINKQYSRISQSVCDQSYPESLGATGGLQIGLGADAEKLAKSLYRSKARFLFELIQNAEDNEYSKGKALGVEPCVKFTIRPHTISIDCNEDGFTPDNIRALCCIGETTKIRKYGQDYIGEKGIGFKSVFMVASKVHIQSGPFSFYFKHEPGNNGMGMITPI